MKRSTAPYALPRKIEAELARVLGYWRGLKRGNNEIPFADDLNLPALRDVSERLMLLEVFERPARFRLAIVGSEIKAKYHGDLDGKFVDEIEIRDPLRYLASQSSATLESRKPTYYYTNEKGGGSHQAAYSRLLLPMWGDGRIETLLAAFCLE